MTSPIDQPWPPDGLEEVSSCPYCGSEHREVAYSDVQDWSFFTAPGRWVYQACLECEALYLDPRPTPASIGLAYAAYYTHDDAPASWRQALRLRLSNEAMSRQLGVAIGPCLGVWGLIPGLAAWVQRRFPLPFGYRSLSQLPRGTMVDVGCGDGRVVELAGRLGWRATGVEIDPLAVRLARSRGLDVLSGSYSVLADSGHRFDLIWCSHVLEHVHDPLDLLRVLRGSLQPGGTLLLTLPNAGSALRRHFGPNWRGLEAPRHLALPEEMFLRALLERMGFEVESLADGGMPTGLWSYCVERRGLSPDAADRRKARKLAGSLRADPPHNDFIKLVCRLAPAQESSSLRFA